MNIIIFKIESVFTIKFLYENIWREFLQLPSLKANNEYLIDIDMRS
jgi:hypothetical protein